MILSDKERVCHSEYQRRRGNDSGNKEQLIILSSDSLKYECSDTHKDREQTAYYHTEENPAEADGQADRGNVDSKSRRNVKADPLCDLVPEKKHKAE